MQYRRFKKILKYIETACIGVNRSNGSQTGVITEGLSVGGTAANFQSDNANFKVAINDNAEAYLKNVYSVSVWSWSDDHSSASVALVCAADGSEHTVDAVITTEEISAADCENDRVVKYTATAEYDGGRKGDLRLLRGRLRRDH